MRIDSLEPAFHTEKASPVSYLGPYDITRKLLWMIIGGLPTEMTNETFVGIVSCISPDAGWTI